MRYTIGVDSVVRSQSDLQFQYFTTGELTRSQQGICSIPQLQQVIYTGSDAKRIPDDGFIALVTVTATEIVIPLVIFISIRLFGSRIDLYDYLPDVYQYFSELDRVIHHIDGDL